MPLDKKPVFRRVIVPWYDSETACLVLIVSMVAVFLFGIAGVSVALENHEYRNFIWVPLLLVAMSGGVIFSTVVRLAQRYTHRFSK